jgi:hypothetical protein
MPLKPVSRPQFEEVKTWFDENQALFPSEISAGLKSILAAYLSLSHGAARARQTLNTLRQAMGFSPKSERGSTDNFIPPESLPGQKPLTSEEQERYAGLIKKRAELTQKKSEYDRELKRLLPKQKSKQLELPLEQGFEMMFSYPSIGRQDVGQKQVVNRMNEFDKERGLHLAHDYTKRVDFKMTVTDITYQVETVTDPETGKSVRASMADEGPEKFQMTWLAIANLIKLHVGFAIPINRIVMMIGQPEFSSSKICRVLEYVANYLLAIYLVLAEQLADVHFLSGDDTGTKVLDLGENQNEESLSRQVDEHFGWASAKANGTGDKKALNVSLLVGRTEDNPRSTIRFFRTHLGSVGNLFSRLLEWRNPKFKEIVFQGDLSKTNLPNQALTKLFTLVIAGCGAHARRPFWRYREDDPSLCYFMLKGFLKLKHLEDLIDAKGRTRANVLKYRGRYGMWFWEALRNRCEAAVSGELIGPATFPKGISPDQWPPGTDLHKACMYVINHFDELTVYLSRPELQYTNNGQERALRIEKCMLDGSKFRKTRNGRAVLDILRTINATCTAARLDITDYLRYVFKHPKELQANPEKFTPFAVAKYLEEEKKRQENQA